MMIDSKSYTIDHMLKSLVRY